MIEEITRKLLGPFSPSALEDLSRVIADNYTGTGITALFRKAGFPEIQYDGSTKWRFVFRTLEQLNLRRRNDVLRVVEALCDPKEFVRNPERQKHVLARVNEILRSYGLRVKEDGKISLLSTFKISIFQQDENWSFDVREFHPEIVKHARLLFYEGHYSYAVLECCKALEKLVREKSGIDKHGVELMGAALSLNGPLKINSQSTQSERNEQEGIMHLCKGLMKAIRNPGSHEPVLDWSITREDALDLLSFISFLFRRFERAGYTLKEQDKD